MSESTPVESKTCTKCSEHKPFSEFHRRGKSYRSWCKVCRNGAGKQWRESRPDYYVEYYQRHREKKITYAREYRRLNPGDPDYERERAQRWRAANAERIAEVNRRWKANNPDLVRASLLRCQNRRRARVLGLPAESYTVADLLARDGVLCVLCGEDLDLAAERYHPRSITVEHLECISWPGSAGDVLSNVALAHHSCNMRRGTKPHPAAAQKRKELMAAGRAAG